MRLKNIYKTLNFVLLPCFGNAIIAIKTIALLGEDANTNNLPGFTLRINNKLHILKQIS